MTARRMTLREVRELPATVDVPTAASALGVGKSTLYEAIKAGASPVKTITVQRRVVVLTADLSPGILEGGSGDALSRRIWQRGRPAKDGPHYTTSPAATIPDADDMPRYWRALADR